MMNKLSPKYISVIIHLTAIIAIFCFSQIHLSDNINVENVPVVYSVPLEAMDLKENVPTKEIVLKSVNKNPEMNSASKAIFGMNRNSYTDDTQGSSSVEVKKGNTLAKVADTEKLKDTDSDSLPEPTEEYLVSQMPRVLSEAKPNYPINAKDKKKEGKVILSVLIDEAGKVRSVEVIESDDDFKKEAIVAMEKFRFSPAMVNSKPVAVKIRYTIYFKLEY